jgi:hypothetical protein
MAVNSPNESMHEDSAHPTHGRVNDPGQPIGAALDAWTQPQRPPREPVAGAFCRLEPLDVERHAADLFNANRVDPSARMWTYLAYGPFDTLEAYRAWARQMSQSEDPLFFAVVEQAGGKAIGVAA